MKQVKEYEMSVKFKDTVARMGSMSLLAVGNTKKGKSDSFEVRLMEVFTPDACVNLSVGSIFIAREVTMLLTDDMDNPAVKEIMECFNFIKLALSESDINLAMISMVCQQEISAINGKVCVKVSVEDIKLFEE